MKWYWRFVGIEINYLQTNGNGSLRHIFQFPVKTVLAPTYTLL